jgi:hypothetical protein
MTASSPPTMGSSPQKLSLAVVVNAEVRRHTGQSEQRGGQRTQDQHRACPRRRFSPTPLPGANDVSLEVAIARRPFPTLMEARGRWGHGVAKAVP